MVLAPINVTYHHDLFSENENYEAKMNLPSNRGSYRDHNICINNCDLKIRPYRASSLTSNDHLENRVFKVSDPLFCTEA